MSRLGETVLYGTEGVCKVAEICRMKVGRQREEYYVLKPIHRPNATVFVPVNKPELLEKMRPILSREEIHTMLEQVRTEDRPWIEDAAERKLAYQQILLGGDRRELLGVIRQLYLRREQLHSVGKRLRTNDEQLLREAEKLIDDEFALVLGIEPRAVPDYIRERIEK